MRKTLLLLAAGLPLHAADSLITYENRPMGSAERPLVLRTYLPEPDIDDAAFSQHDTGRKVSKYNPSRAPTCPARFPPWPDWPPASA